MHLVLIVLLSLTTHMDAAPTSQPATTQATHIERLTLALGGTQENAPLEWHASPGDDRTGTLFSPAQVTLELPDSRRIELSTANIFAYSLAQKVWLIKLRPAWALTTQRKLADLLRAQLTEWDIPIGEKQEAFLAEMDRVGDEAPDGWNTIQRCNFDLTEQIGFGIRLSGTKASRGKDDGGWFVVFEFALQERSKSKDMPGGK